MAHLPCPMDEAALLRQRFHEHLRALLHSMSRAMTGLAPGPRRLLVAVETYWEACYRRRDLRTEMIAASQRLRLDAELGRASRIFERMLASELTICGVAEPHTLARSLAGEIRAVARAELLAAHRLPWQRRRLIGFMESRLNFCSGLARAAA